MKDARGTFVLWAPVLAYMAVIFAASSVPHPPQAPGDVSDKQLHIVVYAGLGALVVRALAGGWRRRVTLATALLATVVSALYGASDELHQHFVPPRQMEALDLAADALGGALAAFGLLALGWFRQA